MLKSIPGDRAALERQLLDALVDPEGDARFDAILARLTERANLRRVADMSSGDADDAPCGDTAPA